MVWHGVSKRKKTGGRLRRHRKKRAYEYGREAAETKVGERKIRKAKARGGRTKTRLLQAKSVNLYNPKTKKTAKVELEAVVENAANPHFVRRNIITKGAIVKTKDGNARVTNRPGQEGTVNAVLVE